jgi:hypothetical protein
MLPTPLPRRQLLSPDVDNAAPSSLVTAEGRLRVICVATALSYNRDCTIAQWLRRSLSKRKVPKGCLRVGPRPAELPNQAPGPPPGRSLTRGGMMAKSSPGPRRPPGHWQGSGWQPRMRIAVTSALALSWPCPPRLGWALASWLPVRGTVGVSATSSVISSDHHQATKPKWDSEPEQASSGVYECTWLWSVPALTDLSTSA